MEPVRRFVPTDTLPLEGVLGREGARQLEEASKKILAAKKSSLTTSFKINNALLESFQTAIQDTNLSSSELCQKALEAAEVFPDRVWSELSGMKLEFSCLETLVQKIASKVVNTDVMISHLPKGLSEDVRLYIAELVMARECFISPDDLETLKLSVEFKRRLQDV